MASTHLLIKDTPTRSKVVNALGRILKDFARGKSQARQEDFEKQWALRTTYISRGKRIDHIIHSIPTGIKTLLFPINGWSYLYKENFSLLDAASEAIGLVLTSGLIDSCLTSLEAIEAIQALELPPYLTAIDSWAIGNLERVNIRDKSEVSPPGRLLIKAAEVLSKEQHCLK